MFLLSVLLMKKLSFHHIRMKIKGQADQLEVLSWFFFFILLWPTSTNQQTGTQQEMISNGEENLVELWQQSLFVWCVLQLFSWLHQGGRSMET